MQLSKVSFDSLAQSVKKRIAEYVVANIPLARRTIYKTLIAEQPLSTATLDVATAHAILDGTDTGNTNEYFALCDVLLLSDSHLQAELAKRKLAMIGDQMVIAPVDKKLNEDKVAADCIQEMVNETPAFLEACAHLLDGALWPLAITEKVFRRATKNPSRYSYELDKLIRVPPRLFDYSTSFLRIWDTDPETGNVLNTSSDPEPIRYIIHRGHLLPTPDYRGGPMRSLVFWSLFSSFDRDWWARFLDRYGSPFMVGKYDQADDDSRIILENAFQLASKIGGIVISRQTDVELKEAMSKSGGEGFELFFKVCQREKSKLIVGQTTSADAETGGLSGSSVSKVQSQVRADIRQFDSLWLGNTLRYQLFDPFLRINGIAGRAKISWGAEEADDVIALTEGLANLASAGLEPTDESLQTIGTKVGYALQRKKIETPPAVPGLPGGPRGRAKPLSAMPANVYERADMANGSIARVGAAKLAPAFRGAFAPIARFIDESGSSDELIEKISHYYADWSPQQLTPVIIEALSAHAANGAARDSEKTNA